MSPKLEKLKEDLNQSLKNGDTIRVGTLRFLISEIRNSSIAKYGALGEEGLTDDDIVGVVKKQVKSHRESIEAFENAGRTELAAKEKQELDILASFLPAQISDEELKALVSPLVRSGEKNFGLLMKQAMVAVGGKADGARVSSILKQLMTS